MLFVATLFQALINISIEELCETGNALLAPVRLGVARPTAPFSLSSTNTDSLSVMDELFNVDPLAKSESGNDRSSRKELQIRSSKILGEGSVKNLLSFRNQYQSSTTLDLDPVSSSLPQTN